MLVKTIFFLFLDHIIIKTNEGVIAVLAHMGKKLKITQKKKAGSNSRPECKSEVCIFK